MSRTDVIFEYQNEGKKCIYLMTKTFRIKNNYSLFEANNYSKKNNLPLDIYIVKPYELNNQNYEFFFEKTKDLKDKLKEYARDVFEIDREENLENILKDAKAIFIDKLYLRFDLNFLEKIKRIAFKDKLNLYAVESNVFVPVKVASDKEEYSARTIRNKINSKLDDYREEVLENENKTLAEKEAFEVLQDFISNKLQKYDLHNDPSLELTSLLSPYLKYGFVSPVSIYNEMRKIKSENKESFLEELIVRRELAYNFVYYNPTYDDFNYITYDWAYNTMDRHINDKRDYIYKKEDYINFNTHDKYFNAAMKEMVYLGRMHSYMRMYWCKKIIEWSSSYKEAYETAIELNNYYFIDGLTPNGYCGVAWCFGKHDRAWTERPVFGKLRYMNDNGLKRKFDIETYVKKMDKIEKRKR
ncbi:MAG: deoxyribodipyrimidine photo-lyase [Candidatus Izemoplasmatales bacterium]|jgi:deoxyribodipyrimidine photo-lyase|nr:deoxyribodipyrimidine photo-lyase [Candidatus Izemoplasmatales bacterium]